MKAVQEIPLVNDLLLSKHWIGNSLTGDEKFTFLPIYSYPKYKIVLFEFVIVVIFWTKVFIIVKELAKW